MDEFMQEFEYFMTQTQRDSSFRDSISMFGFLFLHELNKLESNKKCDVFNSIFVVPLNDEHIQFEHGDRSKTSEHEG